MKNFDWGNPFHWVYLSLVCAVFVMLEKPITMLFQGMGLAAKAIGSVPVMVFTGGRNMVAPELSRYSVPGNVGGPLPESMGLEELPKVND